MLNRNGVEARGILRAEPTLSSNFSEFHNYLILQTIHLYKQNKLNT